MTRIPLVLAFRVLVAYTKRKNEGNTMGEIVTNIIIDSNEPVYVSAASAYEIMNKYRIGKLVGYAHVAERYRTFRNKEW